jgi:hypothetical protein
MNKGDKPDDPKALPFWKLVASHDAALTYSFKGYRNSGIFPQSLRFNYTQCASSAMGLYNGTLLQAYTSSWPNMSLVTEPRVTGTFSNGSAWLEMESVYRGKTAAGNTLGGNMTVIFNGTVDETRSDQLVSNVHGSTPVWASTLGYEKSLTGEIPAIQLGSGSRAGFHWSWTIGILHLLLVYGL